MPDYKNGKIYKLVCDTTNKIYIGSTTEKYLSRRLAKHIYDFKNKEKKNFVSSYEILKNNNFHIELIENINSNDIYELHNRERYYVENTECVNIQIPNRTQRERNKTEEYTNKRIVRQKKYREKHKDKLNEKVLCECGCNVNKYNLSRHKKTKKHLELILKNV